MFEVNDVTVIGSGPAGLQAAISAASELPKVAVIERALRTGGAAGTSSHIENIAGYDESGQVIMNRMTKMACKMGARFVMGHGVRAVHEFGTNVKLVELDNGAFVPTKTVIIATGLDNRQLGIPGEATYINRDVLYGSHLTKVRSCKGMPVAIVGGANSAGQLALYAAQFASEVNILIRGESIRKDMSEYLVGRIEAAGNIKVVNQAAVSRVEGNERLRYVVYQRDGRNWCLPACALFVCVGSRPVTGWVPEEITRDEQGFLVADGEHRHETKVPGIFVAGDINAQSVKRVGGAIGQGTEAVTGVHAYLNGREFSM